MSEFIADSIRKDVRSPKLFTGDHCDVKCNVKRKNNECAIYVKNMYYKSSFSLTAVKDAFYKLNRQEQVFMGCLEVGLYLTTLIDPQK